MNAKVQFDNIETTQYRTTKTVFNVNTVDNEEAFEENLREELKSLVALEVMLVSSRK